MGATLLSAICDADLDVYRLSPYDDSEAAAVFDACRSDMPGASATNVQRVGSIVVMGEAVVHDDE